MTVTKADIIAGLQKDILALQGFRTVVQDNAIDKLVGKLKEAFPNKTFPLGVMHEFIYAGLEDAAATGGFVSGLLAALMHTGSPVIWIGPSLKIFPPALSAFGIAPEKIIFLELKKEKEILWAIEESLKCEGLAAVIGELSELGFTASRRFQLAVEKSKVTGFILRNNPRNLHTTACVSRWQVSAITSGSAGEMPGVGFPRWNVELLKARNGKAANWQIEWVKGRFRYIHQPATVIEQLKQKVV